MDATVYCTEFSCPQKRTPHSRRFVAEKLGQFEKLDRPGIHAARSPTKSTCRRGRCTAGSTGVGVRSEAVPGRVMWLGSSRPLPAWSSCTG